MWRAPSMIFIDIQSAVKHTTHLWVRASRSLGLTSLSKRYRNAYRGTVGPFWPIRRVRNALVRGFSSQVCTFLGCFQLLLSWKCVSVKMVMLKRSVRWLMLLPTRVYIWLLFVLLRVFGSLVSIRRLSAILWRNRTTFRVHNITLNPLHPAPYA